MDAEALNNLADALNQRGGGGGAGARMKRMEETSPQAWLAFRSNFERTLPLLNWNLNRQKRELLALLDEQPASCVQNLPLHIDEPDYGIVQLLDAFATRFLSGPATEQALNEFNACKQKADETVMVFHSRLRQIHARAYPNIPDGQRGTDRGLISKFRTGLADSQLRVAAVGALGPNYDQLLEQVNSMHSALESLRSAHGPSVNSLTTNQPSTSSGNPMVAQMGTGQSYGQPRPSPMSRNCYVCGQPGHGWRFCQDATALKVFQILKINPKTHRTYRSQGNSGPNRNQGSSNTSGQSYHNVRGGSVKKNWNNRRPPNNRRNINSLTDPSEEGQQETEDGGHEDPFSENLSRGDDNLHEEN